MPIFGNKNNGRLQLSKGGEKIQSTFQIIPCGKIKLLETVKIYFVELTLITEII